MQIRVHGGPIMVYLNVPDLHKVKDMEYILAVLDWQIYKATCNASTSNLNTSTSFCGVNALCSPDTQTSSLTCHYPPRYEGNPYLPQGCQGTQSIEEC
ncbi:hypothetical protein CK203_039429 [Vitis vinifera]|uniref:Uncharacterized protein n=1 Tax=Vitis vinifera TaxID=29760 RepID=A0A438I750_VITVI|nr:hypothetical protein CK203_039429 [Vitis vinifera]